MMVGEGGFPRIVRRRLAPSGSLAGDALAGLGVAAGLFTHAPAARPDPAGSGLEDASPSPLPAAAFRVASPEAAERLDRVLAGDGLVVTTGQQPGLFLGPLYSLYKAVTAVRLAEDVEGRTGRPTVAVFWVASDDHDWEEVAACRILDGDEELVTLRLDPSPELANRSVGTATLPEGVNDLLDHFRQEAGGAVVGATPAWFGAFCDAYRPERTFGTAFADALCAALEGRPLVVLDSGRPEVRRTAADLYQEIIDAPGGVIDARAAGRQAVTEAGYEPVLTPPPEGLQIFFDDGRARQHILHASGAFDVGGPSRLDTSDVVARLIEEPERFTPAAALRPVLESRLLPVACTVLGPGEITYWAQLRPLFGALGVAMPAIAPRDAWTLVEPRVERLLEKLDLEVGQVEREGTGIDDRWVAGARPPAVRAALEALDADLVDAFDALEEAVERELPGITSAAGKARHRTAEALAEFSGTVDARVRERESVALGQAERLRRHLTPGGSPQERVLGAAQFLARHGRALVDDLLEASCVAAPNGQD